MSATALPHDDDSSAARSSVFAAREQCGTADRQFVGERDNPGLRERAGAAFARCSEDGGQWRHFRENATAEPSSVRLSSTRTIVTIIGGRA